MEETEEFAPNIDTLKRFAILLAVLFFAIGIFSWFQQTQASFLLTALWIILTLIKLAHFSARYAKKNKHFIVYILISAALLSLGLFSVHLNAWNQSPYLAFTFVGLLFWVFMEITIIWSVDCYYKRGFISSGYCISIYLSFITGLAFLIPSIVLVI